MGKITAYIPCYISDRKRFKREINATLKSLQKYDTFFRKINFFICQDEQYSFLEGIANNYSFKYEIIYLEQKKTLHLPIGVFQYMQQDRETSDESLLFYNEADHILHINNKFWVNVEKELKNGNIVMPHRLGKIKAFEEKEYPTYEGYFVGNLAKQGIQEINQHFNLMKCWSSNNQNHNAYAGCFFSKKTSLKSISLKKYSGFFEICIKIFAYFHKYDFLRKIIKNFIVGYPFGLVLEAPSLVLSFMGINVLKTVDIGDLYVIHLSQNGYV